MKTTKRVIAVALAVLMLALAIPFAVSAVTSYTLTVQCDKPDYTYTVYKIADFNETTGHFEEGKTTAITAAINQSTESTAAVLTAANAATDAQLGDAVGTFTSDATTTSKNFIVPAGMYYIKCTGVSINNDSIKQNNIVPLPNKNMAAGATTFTVDVATNKIKENGEPSVYKDIKKGDELVKETSVSGDETITYVLKADVTGTQDNKLAKYIIADDMDTDNTLKFSLYSSLTANRLPILNMTQLPQLTLIQSKATPMISVYLLAQPSSTRILSTKQATRLLLHSQQSSQMLLRKASTSSTRTA